MDTFTNLLACSVCMTEIPESEATSVEATDYVAHFCGLECYVLWRDHGVVEAGVRPLPDAGRADAA